MSGMSFATVFLFGGGAIALWINVRFPKLCPDGLKRALLHLVDGTIALDLIAPLGTRLAGQLGQEPAVRMTPIFLLTLPTLIYWLLGVSWMIRITQSLMGGHIR